ncbi:MAG: hypothetical protein LBR34_09435, partial [Prevotella sp.]|nr:hypothetical protein [Prevotella sp.]
MKNLFYSFAATFAILSVPVAGANKTATLPDADKKIVQKFLDEWDSQYDDAEKMLTETITDWQY